MVVVATFKWLREKQGLWDLANSGVSPLNYKEYIAEPGVDLAEAVSEAYGVDRRSVVLTSGAQEGNFLALWALRKKADRVFVFLPEYEPIYVLPDELGYRKVVARGDPFQLVERGAVLFFSNPNNPTGRYLDAKAVAELADEARRRGAFLVVDAIFVDFVDDVRGLPSEGAVFNFSTSKFYTSSVKVGWSFGEDGVVKAMKDAKDLFNPGPSPLEAQVGYGFLTKRAEVKSRNISLISKNWRALRDALRGVEVRYREHMPIAFLEVPCGGAALAERLAERGVATVPGRYFGVDGALRIGLARVDPAEFQKPVSILVEEVDKCIDGR
ncbi:MAG: pyridoxal phosphate-dependent aminotransferase [Thermoproteus sp.]